ncbi:ubiquitin thioesterase otulin isoform X1 [Python bivittatus]|uniref:Ubiquitin thioesterase otulin isoform X1 n=1 Tax=Python bivittatus TaxID=176946 RepID=A0A9F2NP09_PYTBI|nr:ubiquitin thioesterase otulin isoform X1 [Python bivittatus]XP_007420430.1 ubiquitin thioesterase otulin isoform X1 [Python bivittatus]
MSTDKDELLCTPVDNGKAAPAAVMEDENKLAKQRPQPESRARAGPCSATVADNTKRFKLSNVQAQSIQESPGMSQPKARKASGPPVTTEEKRRKGFFSIPFSKGKKEKGSPCDKMSSTSISHKLIANEDSACHLQRAQADVLKTSLVHQEKYLKRKEQLPASVIPCPMEFSVDLEEDLYRDADEIEREKVLLESGTDSPDFPENKLSVEPEVDIMDYSQEEWRGNTSYAECIRKGYEAVSHKFISIRRVRGDNYCALRATLFQALSQAAQLPQWLQKEDLMLLPEKLMVKYEWITQWRLRHMWTSKVESLMDEIKDCLMLLKRKWKNMSDMKTFVERQAACDELFRSEEEEYKLYEAVKFLMLSTAIKLYEDSEKGKEVPVFSWLLFARDTSSNPSQLMVNHLNQLGYTGGLEQVEMFLLAYALQHTIQVYRLYKYRTEEFITLYPNDPEETWPLVTLITEDDRHYNIPARMCEETSV